MLVHVLGSAAGGGFPQWNCNCPQCSGVRSGRIRATPRTQSSLAVSDDGERWVLINASPDIRAQIDRFPRLKPGTPVRASAIAAVVLMDSQIDHTTGLLSLREGRQLTVHCTDMVRQDLTSGFPVLTMLGHYATITVRDIPIADSADFSVDGIAHVRFTAIPLSSKAPPYSPHRHDPHRGDNIGLRIVDIRSGRRLFYAPGLGALDAAVRAEIAAADCVLVDGTCWHDDDMARAGVGGKRAREMGHLPQAGAGGMLEELVAFSRPRKILI
ncbi:MAG TPA: pyrroloquinoline quinone biosynthesis protein PqqB, partial [Planctomycetota bacterium]|nr:pyrroloquinoline quinone biosynthesis protein PqqB [Planctomycetota bacterium]